jgi:DUF4097 and DUF4098 domain-containing protein YvlB
MAAAVMFLASLAAAQQSRVYQEGGSWIQEVSGTLGSARNLRVKVDVGSVRVEGGSESGISYVVRNHSYNSAEDKARREFASYKINAFVRGDTAWIVGDWQEGRPRKFSAEFVISVPRETDLAKIDTEGGGVSVTGIAGRVECSSGGGSIHVDNVGGGVNAQTGGGSIEIGSAGGELSLHTGGGNIRVSSSKGRITAESGGGNIVITSGGEGAKLETGGGSIRVQECAGPVKASTGGGNIDLGDIGSGAEMETGGGSIRLSSAKGLVRAETGAGSISLNGVPAAHAETGAGGIVARFVSGGGERSDSWLRTSAGDITVYLASDLRITVRASIEAANGHRISSDFPSIRVSTEGGDWGPKFVSAEGSLNGGGPVLKVSTTSGDILIRRGQ